MLSPVYHRFILNEEIAKYFFPGPMFGLHAMVLKRDLDITKVIPMPYFVPTQTRLISLPSPLYETFNTNSVTRADIIFMRVNSYLFCLRYK